MLVTMLRIGTTDGKDKICLGCVQEAARGMQEMHAACGDDEIRLTMKPQAQIKDTTSSAAGAALVLDVFSHYYVSSSSRGSPMPSS